MEYTVRELRQWWSEMSEYERRELVEYVAGLERFEDYASRILQQLDAGVSLSERQMASLRKFHDNRS